MENCIHDLIDDNGIMTCLLCGEIVHKLILYDQERRYFNIKDSKSFSDPTRVQARKNEISGTIRKEDIETLGISDKIITIANGLYTSITKGQIFRGLSRKSMIFACVFYAYIISGSPQNYDDLSRLFGLSKKNAIKGIKTVNSKAPKDSEIHTTIITPNLLIQELMLKFNANKTQIDEVLILYEKIKNRSTDLNRSRPQSIASGITYYWLKESKIEIKLKDFAQISKLSELTINKVVKEINMILKTS